jgi:hypothetical protein
MIKELLFFNRKKSELNKLGTLRLKAATQTGKSYGLPPALPLRLAVQSDKLYRADMMALAKLSHWRIDPARTDWFEGLVSRSLKGHKGVAVLSAQQTEEIIRHGAVGKDVMLGYFYLTQQRMYYTVEPVHRSWESLSGRKQQYSPRAQQSSPRAQQLAAEARKLEADKAAALMEQASLIATRGGGRHRSSNRSKRSRSTDLCDDQDAGDEEELIEFDEESEDDTRSIAGSAGVADDSSDSDDQPFRAPTRLVRKSVQ